MLFAVFFMLVGFEIRVNVFCCLGRHLLVRLIFWTFFIDEVWCILQGNGGCNYFGWYDPPICARGRQIIPGLLKRVDLLEKKVEAVKRRERKLWISFCICFFALMCKVFSGQWCEVWCCIINEKQFKKAVEVMFWCGIVFSGYMLSLNMF